LGKSKMNENARVLAVIPARGESKRLPRKNLLPLSGKPMIAWTIEAALKAACIDQIVVSTDDDEIAEVASSCGAEVPFLRPAELASDSATTDSVVAHTVESFEAENGCFTHICLLQPTSPLRSNIDIDASWALLKEKKARAVVSVTAAEHTPLWCNTLSDDLSMKGFLPSEKLAVRSQELPTYYRLNGAIYLFEKYFVGKMSDLYNSDGVFAFKMESEASIDVDTQIEFQLAEMIMNSKHSH